MSLKTALTKAGDLSITIAMMLSRLDPVRLEKSRLNLSIESLN